MAPWPSTPQTQTFRSSRDPSTFEWNTIIRSSHPRHALSIYVQSILPSRAHPNKFTFTFLLKACLLSSTHHLTKHLHNHITKLGLHSDPFLQSSLITAYAHSGHITTVQHLFHHRPHHHDLVLHTALVSAYAKCGMPDAAHQAFDKMPHPNSVSWAAVISAYTRSGRHTEALSLFRRMRLANVNPTEAALVSVLTSSAHLGALEEGELAQHYISKAGLTPSLGTALLTMYARCGRIEAAVRVFDEMPHRDPPAWTAMISAFAAHGQGARALYLYEEMLGLGHRPDHVTYVAVLHACSHAGLIEEARHHFDRMKVYKIMPGVEHYGCMVDMLARRGHVEAAWKLVGSMPMEPDEFVLKSLLSACCSHGRLEYAELAAKKLMDMDAGHPSSYVLLSNAYAGLGQWEDCARVRKMMRERGVPKAPGCSAVD